MSDFIIFISVILFFVILLVTYHRAVSKCPRCGSRNTEAFGIPGKFLGPVKHTCKDCGEEWYDNI